MPLISVLDALPLPNLCTRVYHGLEESGDSPGQPKTGYGRHIARNS